MMIARFFRRLQPMLPVTGMICIILLSLVAVGMLLYRQGQGQLEQQLRDRLRDTAAAAAMQFDPTVLASIHKGDTPATSPALRDVVMRLRALREQLHEVRFIYLMRRTKDPNTLEFIADADIASTESELDRNKNGVVDQEEMPSQPGDLYSLDPFPALREEAFLHPTVDAEIGVDQWGPVISGYAPIVAKDGVAVAVLGIDMSADDFLRSSRNLFSPVVSLLVLLSLVSIGSGAVLFAARRRVEILRRLEVERSGLLRLTFHQLGGPLTIIRWSLEELQESGSPEDRRTIANIQEGLKRLMGILKTLKDADQVHAGRLSSTPEIVQLDAVIDLVTKQVGSKLAVRRQRVQVHTEPSLQISMDRSLAIGLFEELITNAIDYSPDGAETHVTCRKVGRMAEIIVADHGYGIPRKDQHRIFGEFIRASNATRYKADGNGLGLYIVKGIVEHAGGTIALVSDEGKGTTITVRLPLA